MKTTTEQARIQRRVDEYTGGGSGSTTEIHTYQQDRLTYAPRYAAPVAPTAAAQRLSWTVSGMKRDPEGSWVLASDAAPAQTDERAAKLYRFLEPPEHILSGDEIWSHRGSEWRTVSPDFIDTEYSNWMPPVRRATAPQATVKDDEFTARIRKWRDAFDAMHRRAMSAETRVRELEVGIAAELSAFKDATRCASAKELLDKVIAEKARAAVPQAGATLTDRQIEALADTHDTQCFDAAYGFTKDGLIAFARAVRAAHPTEQRAGGEA